MKRQIETGYYMYREEEGQAPTVAFVFTNDSRSCVRFFDSPAEYNSARLPGVFYGPILLQDLPEVKLPPKPPAPPATETPPEPPRPAESTSENPRPNYRMVVHAGEPVCETCRHPEWGGMGKQFIGLCSVDEPPQVVEACGTCDAHTPINSVTSGK